MIRVALVNADVESIAKSLPDLLSIADSFKNLKYWDTSPLLTPAADATCVTRKLLVEKIIASKTLMRSGLENKN